MNNYTIVSVNVSEIVAATPSTLQKTGCIVSVGGTTLAAGQVQLITQVADYTAIIGSTPDSEPMMTMSSSVTQ